MKASPSNIGPLGHLLVYKPAVPYHLHNLMSKQHLGLKQRLQVAKSPSDITDLLKLGATFTDASPTTRRSWEKIAKTRRYQLANGG